MLNINWSYLADLDFGIVWEYREVLGKGLLTTLLLTVASTTMGFLAGSILAIGARSPVSPLRWVVTGYVELWRNTPLVVQLIWIHFALPMFTNLSTTAFQSGLITLTLGVTAYFTEIMRAGIGGVPKGQWEAGHALGLPVRTFWIGIILPQAFRIMVPPLASLVINIFKATAILSILSVNELMQVSNKISNFTFRPIEVITSVALIYFVVGTIMSWAAGQIEQKFRKSDR